MKAVVFEGTIDGASVKALLADIDKIDPLENIVLYFTSGGGSLPDTETLTDYINRDPKRFEIGCFWSMSSSAFDLLLNVKCRILLGKTCYAQLHLYSNDLQYCNLGDKQSFDLFTLNRLNARNKVWLGQLRKAGLSTEELDFIRKGGSVILDATRMAHVLRTIGGRK